ncbi:saccharopine dehydrogenase [bacterium]|nr:saccharopine dehydrogenase [bacterium]
MKHILVLGAGQSAPYLIDYLLKNAEEYDWFVTVGDIDLDLAAKRVDNHPRGQAVRFNVHSTDQLRSHVKKADVVVHMLSPAFLTPVAWECIEQSTHLISVSYRDRSLIGLDDEALKKGILMLFEMGLDPGIDHMSAMKVIQHVRDNSGHIEKFYSYGSGIPAPENRSNPFNYVITWNPRNVVMAGLTGAQYLEHDEIKIVPYHMVFSHTWRVKVPDLGVLEAYPNRDSLGYKDAFGLKYANTMVRGTLRWPGWSETWLQIVRLGLPNEHMEIPDLANRSYKELVEMFLPPHYNGSNVRQRVGNYLQISPTGSIMEKLEWFGLFSEEKIGDVGTTACDAMVALAQQKMHLLPGSRDMVALVHDMDVTYPDEDNRRERIFSHMKAFGDPDGFTAMAKAVGLPAALAVKLLLTNKLPLTGAHIPTHPMVYEPILAELAESGIEFREDVTAIHEGEEPKRAHQGSE